MEDNFGARLDSVLVECRPLNYLSLQSIVDQGDEFESQGLEDSRRWYAVRQKIIQFRSDL